MSWMIGIGEECHGLYIRRLNITLDKSYESVAVGSSREFSLGLHMGKIRIDFPNIS